MKNEKKMSRPENTKTRALTAVIVLVSLAGIVFFGIRMLIESSRKDGENPYVYDIEPYRQSGSDRIGYRETARLQLDSHFEQVYGLAVGPQDNIYVSGDSSTGDSSIRIFDSSGRQQSELAAGNSVRCLAVDAARNLYLGFLDHVEVYSSQGDSRARWDSLGEDAIITSIAVAEDAVYTADAGNKIVWKWNKKGELLKRIGEKNEAKDIPGFVIPSPYFDVGIDPDGFLWATNTGRHSLENYTPEGGFRTSWGEYSPDIQGFFGCCNPTHIAFLEDGSFITSEKGIPRVKVYDRLGRLAAVVAGPDSFQEGTTGLDLAVDSRQRILVLDPKQKSVRIYVKKSEEERQ